MYIYIYIEREINYIYIYIYIYVRSISILCPPQLADAAKSNVKGAQIRAKEHEANPPVIWPNIIVIVYDCCRLYFVILDYNILC